MWFLQFAFNLHSLSGTASLWGSLCGSFCSYKVKLAHAESWCENADSSKWSGLASSLGGGTCWCGDWAKKVNTCWQEVDRRSECQSKGQDLDATCIASTGMSFRSYAFASYWIVSLNQCWSSHWATTLRLYLVADYRRCSNSFLIGSELSSFGVI